MVRIDVVRGEQIEKITFKGHADYADYGSDIVCAAVSATFICTVNGILSINSEAIKVSTIEDSQVIEVISKDVYVLKLLNNMLACLESLEKKYPKNIQVR